MLPGSEDILGMNKQNASVLPLVGLSVVLSLSALIAVGVHWSSNTTASAPSAAVMHRMAAPMKTVRVVMHDPGCHWFQTDAGLKRTLQVSGSGVRLVNMDEAALRVAGSAGTKLDHVGGSVRLARGSYRITMVGQKPDDNTLRLVVS
jgi:hypothetical protein